jgi:hypothetical protein
METAYKNEMAKSLLKTIDGRGKIAAAYIKPLKSILNEKVGKNINWIDYESADKSKRILFFNFSSEIKTSSIGQKDDIYVELEKTLYSAANNIAEKLNLPEINLDASSISIEVYPQDNPFNSAIGYLFAVNIYSTDISTSSDKE